MPAFKLSTYLHQINRIYADPSTFPPIHTFYTISHLPEKTLIMNRLWLSLLAELLRGLLAVLGASRNLFLQVQF